MIPCLLYRSYYKFFNFSSVKKIEFKNRDDILNEIIYLYDDALEKGYKVGEAIYTQSFFFADHSLLVNRENQSRIKEYLY